MKKIFFTIVTIIFLVGCGNNDKNKSIETKNISTMEKSINNTKTSKEKTVDYSPEIAKTITNLATFVSDLSAYYVSQGKIEGNLKNITFISFQGDENINQTKSSKTIINLLSANKKCLKLTIVQENINSDIKIFPYIVVEKGNDENEIICKEILKQPQVKKMMESNFTPKKCKTKTEDNSKCQVWEKDNKSINGIALSSYEFGI